MVHCTYVALAAAPDSGPNGKTHFSFLGHIQELGQSVSRHRTFRSRVWGVAVTFPSILGDGAMLVEMESAEKTK